MLVVRNDDRPGVIGRVGTILGDAGVNIADMDVGRSAGGASALMVVSTTEPVPDRTRQQLESADGVLTRHAPSAGDLILSPALSAWPAGRPSASASAVVR